MPDESTAAPSQDFDYIIETGRDGELHQTSPRPHVVDVLHRAVESGKPIVLHLHGGLVSQQSGYEMANALQRPYLDAGYFPIFIVWHTGILDAVKNARELVERPLFDKLLRRLLKHFDSRYGGPEGKGRELANAPNDAEVEAELAKRYVGGIPYEGTKPQPDQEEMSDEEKDALLRSVAGDDDLRKEWEREVEAPESLPGGKELQMNAEVRDEARREFAKPEGKSILSGALVARHTVVIAVRVLCRFFRHRDHGLHTTVVEEILRELWIDRIGTGVWGAMKKDAADTFHREGKLPERGGWLLMHLLGDAIKKRHAAGESLPILSIVGHSAGCIYAGNLLSYLHKARLAATSSWYRIPFQIEKLVFLAPAVTCRVFAAVLKQHEAAPLHRAFRMYSLRDTDEHGYYEVPVLYSGSLLYIISGLLESFDDGGSGDMPLTGMQRYTRTDHPFVEPEVIKVWQFFRSKPDQLVWSGDRRGPGLNCDAKKHGDFDTPSAAPETIASFLHFLA
jgi:hypothetical protein